MLGVMVTGASGFLGRHFCEGAGIYKLMEVSLRETPIDDIDFSKIDVVLHFAGIAHRMEKTEDSLYYEVNYELTKNLAQAAKQAGVGHFLFVSTIKVYGDDYELLTPETKCIPNDAYGKSKLMAEEALKDLESDDFKVSIVRPPLIYGFGVKGNLLRLIELVEKKKYIPLGKINNQRSMVGIDNLIALLNRIIELKVAGTFLVQDSGAVSTSKLILQIAKEKETQIALVSIPKALRATLKLIAPQVYKRLFGSLVVDDSTTRDVLNFKPPYSFEEGIRLMIKNY